MNFENKGKWLKEAQSKIAARNAQKNESTVVSDNRIEFDTFGGSMAIYADTMPYGNKEVRIGLNSSSRGAIYFNKKIDSAMSVKDANTQVEKDKKEVFNALKTLCNDFDNKVKALLKSKGYTLK